MKASISRRLQQALWHFSSNGFYLIKTMVNLKLGKRGPNTQACYKSLEMTKQTVDFCKRHASKSWANPLLFFMHTRVFFETPSISYISYKPCHMRIIKERCSIWFHLSYYQISVERISFILIVSLYQRQTIWLMHWITGFKVRPVNCLCEAFHSEV